MEDVASYFSSEDFPDFELEGAEQQGNCNFNRPRCQDIRGCWWDFSSSRCRRHNDGQNRCANFFDRSRCSRARGCRWDSSNRRCRRASSNGGQNRCANFNRSRCNQVRGCWFDIPNSRCRRSNDGFDRRCRDLTRRQCERDSGCRFFRNRRPFQCVHVRNAEVA